MAWTLCTSGAAIAKAGENADSSVTASGATLAEWSNEIEGAICAKTRFDWIANYASVGTNFKPILADTASSMIAMNIINYNMGGYTSRAEAQTMLDVLRDNYVRNLEILADIKFKDIMV